MAGHTKRPGWRPGVAPLLILMTIAFNGRLSWQFFDTGGSTADVETISSLPTTSRMLLLNETTLLETVDKLLKQRENSSKLLSKANELPKKTSSPTSSPPPLPPPPSSTTVQTAAVSKNMTVNVMFGMAGDKPGFINEWEVALKSILVNAPTDGDLHVHMICNKDAFFATRARIDELNIVGTRWRNQITITIYDVRSFTTEWLQFLTEKIRGHRLDARVTLGGYYRLLAHKILPPNTGHVIYMDTDAVIISNLNKIWRLIDKTKVIQLAALESLCSGFMLLNMDWFDTFWDKLDTLPNITHGGDQSLVVEFQRNFPELVGELPKDWNNHLGNGFRAFAHQLLPKRDTGAGFLHFNGFRPGGETYYDKGLSQYCIKGCNLTARNRKNFQSSWALADYYVRLSWEWAKYFGESTIRPDEDGHPLRFQLYDGGKRSLTYSSEKLKERKQ